MLRIFSVWKIKSASVLAASTCLIRRWHLPSKACRPRASCISYPIYICTYLVPYVAFSISEISAPNTLLNLRRNPRIASFVRAGFVSFDCGLWERPAYRACVYYQSHIITRILHILLYTSYSIYYVSSHLTCLTCFSKPPRCALCPCRDCIIYLRLAAGLCIS